MDQTEEQPNVLAKPETPFFFSPKFLGILGIAVLIVAGLFFYKTSLQPKGNLKSSPPPQAVKPLKTLKSLIGIIKAVDPPRSRITISSDGKNQSFPVSSDVAISQIVLGASFEDGKQISLPTTLIYMEDLKKKIGQEVYLVFDNKGENVIQIQMWQKTAQK